jgi:hypothetical protein
LFEKKPSGNPAAGFDLMTHDTASRDDATRATVEFYFDLDFVTIYRGKMRQDIESVLKNLFFKKNFL